MGLMQNKITYTDRNKLALNLHYYINKNIEEFIKDTIEIRSSLPRDCNVVLANDDLNRDLIDHIKMHGGIGISVGYEKIRRLIETYTRTFLKWSPVTNSMLPR